MNNNRFLSQFNVQSHDDDEDFVGKYKTGLDGGGGKQKRGGGQLRNYNIDSIQDDNTRNIFKFLNVPGGSFRSLQVCGKRKATIEPTLWQSELQKPDEHKRELRSSDQVEALFRICLQHQRMGQWQKNMEQQLIRLEEKITYMEAQHAARVQEMQTQIQQLQQQVDQVIALALLQKLQDYQNSSKQ